MVVLLQLAFPPSNPLLTKLLVALVVFYVPYILVDVPSNWIIKRFRAGFYLPLLIICWGVVSTFLGFTKSYGGLIAARCLLGLFEGGLLGGMVVYLAMFYKRHTMLVGLQNSLHSWHGC